MKHIRNIIPIIVIFLPFVVTGQPNWPAIKSNATFTVADTSYDTPYLQPIHVGGWEDGLFMTRDGKHLYSTFLPVDAFSWLYDLLLNPICFDFDPYFRPPLIGVDTVTNIFGCSNYMQSDIIISSRPNAGQPFISWNSSNLQTSFSLEGGADGVLLNVDTFDVFVYTQDGPGTQKTDIMFMRNVPVNPNTATAVPILNTTAQEDNPHIERLNDTTLLLLFDRDRHMYYSLSYDNGIVWQSPVLITNVLNDQAPYDVQPHLWNDGIDWWVYFCADNVNGIRGIYKSKQLIPNNWDSWGSKELVLESGTITGGYGTIFGIGEPTLTQWGDLSFVVVYGDINSADTTDVFDCDPWFLPKKGSPLSALSKLTQQNNELQVSPNPANENLAIHFSNNKRIETGIEIYDSTGNLIMEMEITTPQKIDISDLLSGLYMIRSNINYFKPVKFLKH